MFTTSLLHGGLGRSGSRDLKRGQLVLLAKMNGSNGATTFVDDSPLHHAITANYNAKISTAQSVFNGSSGLFDGTDDYVSVPAHDAFNLSSDYTLAGWLRPSSFGGSTRYLLQIDQASFDGGKTVWLELSSAGKLRFYVLGAHTGESAALSTGTWYWVGLRRSGSANEMWVHGTHVSGDRTSSDATGTGTRVRLGGVPGYGSQCFDGHMAEWFLLNGYAADLSTVPVSSYPIV